MRLIWAKVLARIICLSTLSGLALTSRADAQGYQLGAADKLQIRVVEWRAGSSEIFEWAGLSGQYTISQSGSLLLPLLGEISAAGKTTSMLAEIIVDGLRDRVGMISRPSAMVEIIQYRPFYITGEVERPGEYPYRPNLTVLQAISLAGGIHRIVETGLLRLDRDRLVAMGTQMAAHLDLRRLLVRRARMVAELSDEQSIQIPEELRGDPEAERLVVDERAILSTRLSELQSRLEALRSLRDLLSKEILSLGEKLETQRRQVELARRELRTISSLREQGLAATSRQFSLERMVGEAEGRLLDYETTRLRAQQDLSKATRDEVDLITERKARLTYEFQQVNADLDQSRVRLATARSLIGEADSTSSAYVQANADRSSRRVTFSILRSIDSRSTEIPVAEMEYLQPGDVVRVSY